MEPTTINLFLATNADLHELLPILDTLDAPVDMAGWPFKLQLKFDSTDIAVALTATVAVSALGELTISAPLASIAALLTGTTKKRKLVGDLLTKPYNGAYIARLAYVEAIVERGVSTL